MDETRLPILSGGAAVGELRIEPQGLYTLFEARIPVCPGLNRLTVRGPGGSADLGLFEPRPEGGFLRRRYTRLEMARLPLPIQQAALESFPPSAAAADKPAPPAEPPASPPAPRTPEPASASLPLPPSPPTPEIWTRHRDGALSRPGWVALPCALRRKTPGLRLIRIEGRDYLLFPYL